MSDISDYDEKKHVDNYDANIAPGYKIGRNGQPQKKGDDVNLINADDSVEIRDKLSAKLAKNQYLDQKQIEYYDPKMVEYDAKVAKM